MEKSVLKAVILALLLAGFVQSAAADEGGKKRQVEPIELLINFQIAGQFTGFTVTEGLPIYTIGGPGYAPSKIFRNGEISDRIKTKRQVTELTGAQITFTGMQTDPVLRFTCLPGSCTMTFADGSVLSSDAGVALEGRAINKWGPIVNSPNFDPLKGIYPVRILGCGGLKEVAGKGRYAGMVGSICFNGQLNFDQNNQMALSGSSKCTITLHTPMDPALIP